MAGVKPKFVALGRIAGPQGLKGQVRVKSFTRPEESILQYGEWRLGEGQVEHELAGGARQGKGLVASLTGIADRDQAEALKGQTIWVRRDSLPASEEGSYYWVDLIGASVVTIDGQELGEVDHLLETGSNDVLVVNGRRERLIPFVYGDSVKSVDLDHRVITVDWDPEY